METAATTQRHLSFRFYILFSWAWVYSPFIQMKHRCSQGLSLLSHPPASSASAFYGQHVHVWEDGEAEKSCGFWQECEREGEGYAERGERLMASCSAAFAMKGRLPQGAFCSSHRNQEKSLLATPNHLPSKAQRSSPEDLTLL